MARRERAIHLKLYPGWSARDNYAMGKHRKKRKRQQQQQQGHPLNPHVHAQGMIKMTMLKNIFYYIYFFLNKILQLFGQVDQDVIRIFMHKVYLK